VLLRTMRQCRTWCGFLRDYPCHDICASVAIAPCVAELTRSTPVLKLQARANAHLAVVGNTLWLLGGLVEVREVCYV